MQVEAVRGTIDTMPLDSRRLAVLLAQQDNAEIGRI
jgi:hypothetical protein